MDTLDEAIHLLAAGERDSARAMVTRIVQTDPKSVTAWRLLASLLDDPAQKMECYRRIIAIAPDHLEAQEKLQQSKPAAQSATLPDQRDDERPPMPVEESLVLVETLPSAIAAPSAQMRSTPDEEPSPAPAKNDFLQRMLVAAVGPGVAKLLGVKIDSDRKGAEVLKITPDDIINMAGGPLPPEERRQCPKCQATISIYAQRCEWCDAQLGEELKGKAPQ